MAAAPSPRTEVKSLRAALVFQAVQLNDPLKAALAGAGVDVVFEGRADGLDRDGLKSAEPQVFVINLDPDLEDHLDDLTNLLDEYDRPVIFNDAAASNTLSGWDQARWARHLAAKIRGEVDSHPPRPAGAALISSPVRAAPAPAAVPAPAAAPAPAPAPAPAAPVVAAPVMAVPAPPMVAPVIAAAPAIVAPMMVAPLAAAPMASAPAPEPLLARAAPAPAADTGFFNAGSASADLDSMFADLLADTPPVPAATKPLAPTVEIPVVALPSLKESPIAEVESDSMDLDFGFDQSPAPAANIVVESDFADFEQFNLPPSSAVTASPSNDFDSTWGDFSADEPVITPAASPAVADDDFGAGLDQAFADFEMPPAPAQASTELTDLDELFKTMEPPAAAPATVPIRAASPAPAPAAPATPSRKAAELKPPPSDWSLEPLDGEGLASIPAPTGRAQFKIGQDAKTVPVVPPPVAPAPAAASNDLGDADLEGFDFFFEPSGASAEAPAPAAGPAKAAAPKVSLDEIPDFGFALDPIDEAPAPAPAPAPVAKPAPAPAPAAKVVPVPSTATAVTKPVPPVPAPAPAARPAPAPAQELGGFDFDFDNFAAAPAPARSDSRAFEAAALADLDGLFADIEAPPVVSDIPNLDRVWILGASIGGPEAVRSFLAGLKKSLPTAFILAQHMGAEFLDLMIGQLAKASPLPVKVAKAGERLQNGEVLVAPVGKRLTLDAQGRIQLGELPNDSAYSPSIDQIMFDMADRFGPRCSAVIFSGMASDAIEGAKYIASKGGRIWVQDPSTCVISSMIDGAQAAGVVNYVGSPEQLAEHLQAHLA